MPMSSIKPNIVVIGDLILDQYIFGNCERISPEAPVQIIDVQKETSQLGGAANVARNLQEFGLDPIVFSAIGSCSNAKEIIKLFEKNNISTSFIFEEKSRVSSKKTRIISSNQQVIRYDKETKSEIDKILEEKIIFSLKSIIDSIDLIILSDYGKGVLSKSLTQSIIALSIQNNIIVIVDPKGNDYSKYKGSYLLTPNIKEASLFIGKEITNENDIYDAAKCLKDSLNLECGLITLSERGIAIYDYDLRIHPTKAKEVFDVTGAGDTVIAAIGYYLSIGKSIDDAIKFANLAAGVVVSKLGSSTASIDEINSFHSNKRIVSSQEQLEEIIHKLKNSDKKIVFTNGCFDILHYGHVDYLETARSFGDVLIVGINSDDSVKKLKGPTRPINKEYFRASIISSLKAVDYVVIFNEETPYNLIKLIKPDTLVKGGDYKGKKIVGEDIVENIEIVDYIDNLSTSAIIQKIQNVSH